MCDIYMFRRGGAWLVYLFGSIGTPVHELGHYFTALLFGHKVLKIELFNPKDDGQLGVVEHSYNLNSFYQRMGCFFISFAPLASGFIACKLITDFMFHDVRLYEFNDISDHIIDSGLIETVKWFYNVSFKFHLQLLYDETYNYVLWALMITSVIKHTLPSKQDLKGSRVGLIPFIIICCCFYFVIPDLFVDFVENVLLFTLSFQVVFVTYVIIIQVVILIFTKLILHTYLRLKKGI